MADDQQTGATATATPDFFPATPGAQPQSTNSVPDFFPAAASAPSASVPDFIPASSPSAPVGTPDNSLLGRAWDYVNKPLLDLHRDDAGPIESGLENFASSFTSPLSVALLVGTMGESAVEQGLVKTGMGAVDAAGAVRKAKLIADAGFLTKYGYDLGTNTLPQASLMWNDYRNAKSDTDRQAALDKLEQFGTESVLNAVTAGMATHGIAGDVREIENASPKGRAMANEHYSKGVYGYSSENQVGTWQAKRIFDQLGEDVKDKDRLSAITRSLEAGGDPAILDKQAREADADPKRKATAQQFRDAMQLSDKEIEVRDKLNDILKGDLAHLKALNLLPEDGGRPNYLPHRWDVEDKDPETGQIIDKTLSDERDFLKKRKFDTFAEGEAAGLKPTTTNPIALVADYHQRVQNVIAKNNLGEKLASSYMNSGAPMAAPGKLFPGFTRAMDAPMTPDEVAKVKASGNFDELLASGRIYETKPGATDTLNAPDKGTGLATIPPNRLVGEHPTPADFVSTTRETQPEYMWKQSDYVPSGLYVMRPVGEAPGEPSTAIVPNSQTPMPNQAIMEPGMRGLPSADSTNVPTARVPLMVNPEVAAHLLPTLEASTPKNALLKAMLKASSEAKSDLLSLSPFHWATILNRTLESGLNPFGGTNRKTLFLPKDIDPFNLTKAQQDAIDNGVVVSSTRPGFSGYLSEGLGAEKDSIISKIPLIGSFNKAIEGRLFGPQGWISSLKFDLYDKLRGEIQKRQPTLTDEQAGRIAASQVNNKFGGLNYTVLGRGAGTQNTLRALLLAPDFLESTGRSVLDVAGSHGGTLAKSLIAFNVAHWLFARGINYLVSGDTHPESGFSVESKDGKRIYNVRTTLGDFLHFASAPRDFLANRVNPLLVRAPEELFEGVDQQGHKVSSAQQVFDTLRQVTPIPLQGLYPNQQVSQPGSADKLAESFGVQSRKSFSPAETLALQLASKKSEGAPLEGDELAGAQKRYKLEDELRDAINTKDQAARSAALTAIHQAARGGEISTADATKIIEGANKYPAPIMATVSRLDLSEALWVYAKGSMTEKRALRPLIAGKIERWKTTGIPAKDSEMRERIAAFRNGQ